MERPQQEQEKENTEVTLDIKHPKKTNWLGLCLTFW